MVLDMIMVFDLLEESCHNSLGSVAGVRVIFAPQRNDGSFVALLYLIIYCWDNPRATAAKVLCLQA
jgi:hypothetical protein